MWPLASTSKIKMILGRQNDFANTTVWRAVRTTYPFNGLLVVIELFYKADKNVALFKFSTEHDDGVTLKRQKMLLKSNCSGLLTKMSILQKIDFR